MWYMTFFCEFCAALWPWPQDHTIIYRHQGKLFIKSDLPFFKLHVAWVYKKHNHTDQANHITKPIHSNNANLREIPQYFRHLVPTLTTSDIDDDVTVGEFWQWLRDYCFAAAKCTRHGTGSTLHTPTTQTTCGKCTRHSAGFTLHTPTQLKLLTKNL